MKWNYLSAAGQWEDGERIWTVRYDGRRRGRSIETAGSLPLGFESTKAELPENDEADPDVFFEMPIDVAEAVTGYRDDMLPGNVLGKRFELLIAGQRGETDGTGSWWKRLFPRGGD